MHDSNLDLTSVRMRGENLDWNIQDKDSLKGLTKSNLQNLCRKCDVKQDGNIDLICARLWAHALLHHCDVFAEELDSE